MRKPICLGVPQKVKTGNNPPPSLLLRKMRLFLGDNFGLIKVAVRQFCIGKKSPSKVVVVVVVVDVDVVVVVVVVEVVVVVVSSK